jgi:hypothetical protein
MTIDQAKSFVQKHGVVLASGKGPVPRLTEAIVSESIAGSWWSHPKAHQIFAVLQAVVESSDVLVCRLVGGKVSLIHRRLWPALVRASARFPKDRLAQVREEHTTSGRHVNREVPFPRWVPLEVAERARVIGEEEALGALGPWTAVPDPEPKKPTNRNGRKRKLSISSSQKR